MPVNECLLGLLILTYMFLDVCALRGDGIICNGLIWFGTKFLEARTAFLHFFLSSLWGRGTDIKQNGRSSVTCNH